MAESILVTYATRYGSTQEVAERVTAVLREEKLPVEIMPARQVKNLASYRAVILGAPLYIGHWLKDARRFLEQNQAVLAQRPVAIFTLGPSRTANETEMTEVRAQLDQELAGYPWLKPVETPLFGGKYDPAKLRFPDNLLALLPASPLHGAPATDLRDWDAIQSWARGLAANWKQGQL